MSFSQYPQNPVIGQEYTVGNMVVTWDGQKFVSVPPVFAGNIRSVTSVEELRTIAATFEGQQVFLSGYYAGSAKGAGPLVAHLTDSPTDDSGVTFAGPNCEWVRQLDGFVTPEMFGARDSDSFDSTVAVRAMHSFCNLSWVTPKYLGIKNIAIDADAKIIINTDVDFCGCVINPLNATVPDADLSFSNSRFDIFVIEDLDRPLVSEVADLTLSTLEKRSVSFASSILPNGGYFRMQGDPTLHLIPNREATAGVVIDIPFRISENGLATLELPTDLSTGSTSRQIYYRLDSLNKIIKVENVSLNTKFCNNQTLFLIKRNGVILSGVHEFLDGQQIFNNSRCGYIRINDCSNIRVEYVTIPGSKSTGSTYVLNSNGAADIYVDGMKSHGRHWGTITGNYINGIYYNDCHADRIDVHAGCYNFYADNCRVNIGCQYGNGAGTFKVSNSRLVFKEQNATFSLISNRNDYGGHFEGRVELINCEIPSDLTGVRIDGVGCDGLQTTCPDVYINGISYNAKSRGFTSYTPLRLRVATAKTGQVIAPKEVCVRNIIGMGSDGAARFEIGLMSMDRFVFSRPWTVVSVSDFTSLYFINIIFDEAVKAPVNTPSISLRVCNGGRVQVTSLDNTPLLASSISNCLVDNINIPANSDLILSNNLYGPHSGTSVIGRDTGAGYNIDVNGGVAKAITGGSTVDFTNVNSMVGFVNKRHTTIFPPGATESTAFTGWKR